MSEHGPTRELLAHLETVDLPPEIAGQPAARRRSPAHRRLARARQITPEIEDEMELFALAWEMVEGGAHEPGAGGDGKRTREEVMTGAIFRVAKARERVGEAGVWLAVVSCVECEPAWQTAQRMGYAGDVETKRQMQAAREWLDQRLKRLFARMTGCPLDNEVPNVRNRARSPELGKEQIPA